jgi:large conductance mechanosensitive channel
MKKFFREFQEFAMRGNVLDMAIGIIIGGAFGKIVSSFVSDVIMPPIGLLLGNTNFSDLVITLSKATETSPVVTLNYGNFIQTTVDFLIIALSVFIMIRALNAAKRRAEDIGKRGKELLGKDKGDKQLATPTIEEVAATPSAPEQNNIEQLLTEIRDLLKREA